VCACVCVVLPCRDCAAVQHHALRPPAVGSEWTVGARARAALLPAATRAWAPPRASRRPSSSRPALTTSSRSRAFRSSSTWPSQRARAPRGRSRAARCRCVMRAVAKGGCQLLSSQRGASRASRCAAFLGARMASSCVRVSDHDPCARPRRPWTAARCITAVVVAAGHIWHAGRHAGGRGARRDAPV
jgi:hypothetical protein